MHVLLPGFFRTQLKNTQRLTKTTWLPFACWKRPWVEAWRRVWGRR